MNIKLRLIVMSFLQFFVWGSWLITIGAYWFQTLPKLYPVIDETTHSSIWTGSAFGALFSTMGIASLFMPALMGIIADKWINAEKLYGICHILGAVVLFTLPMVKDPTTMFWDAFEYVFLYANAGIIYCRLLFCFEKEWPGCSKGLPAHKGLGNSRIYCCFMGCEPSAY